MSWETRLDQWITNPRKERDPEPDEIAEEMRGYGFSEKEIKRELERSQWRSDPEDEDR